MTVEVKIENYPIIMEIDSGAVISVIPEKVYREKLTHCKLQRCTKILTMYNGNTIVPLGKIDVKIEYKNKKKKCSIVIVPREDDTVLMGRDLMEIFEFQIVELNSVTLGDKIMNLKKEFKLLFEDKLGNFKGEPVHLRTKADVKPIFMKPRPIPFAFKKQVEDELDRFITAGVIERVENSEWGTPLVPVLKADGTIRVCADYKVTVNKVLEDIKYPVPRIEELFAALEGGESFTKLDLAWAYNQVEVSQESRLLLAWSTHKGIFAMNRLPFGTKVAVAIFQEKMEKLLQGLSRVKVFLDDIIVTGRTHGKFEAGYGQASEGGY